MTTLDRRTLLSYIAPNVDILFQIQRIYQTKSSRDLSLIGMSIRYAAIVIIMLKFISISDAPLIIGQWLILLTFSTYIALAMYYFANRRVRGRRNQAKGGAARAAGTQALNRWQGD
jgi:hypothetical protein